MDHESDFCGIQSAFCYAVPAGMRLVDDEYKLRQNIKIAMLYLEDDDAVNAEAFIKKAATLIANCKACSMSLPHGLQHVLAKPEVHLCNRGGSLVETHTQAWVTLGLRDGVR